MGAAHRLLDWLTAQDQVRGRSVEYSVRFAITEALREAIDLAPRRSGPRHSTPTAGIPEGGIAELTGHIDENCSPSGPTACGSSCSANNPTPAQLSLFEERRGWRYKALVTNTATGQLA